MSIIADALKKSQGISVSHKPKKHSFFPYLKLVLVFLFSFSTVSLLYFLYQNSGETISRPASESSIDEYSEIDPIMEEIKNKILIAKGLES